MKIPQDQNTTIKAIVKHYEDCQEEGFRAHLGGSIIGRPCDRALWYTFRWATTVRHNGQLLRLFQTGHLAENRFVDDLRSVGITVHEVDPATGEQFRVKDCQGHFGGSFDGVGKGFIEAPQTWHLIEMKTHNEKSFNQLVKKGVQEAKPEHYVQMQTYMYLAKPKLKRAFYIAVNKNTDELYGERIRLDSNIGKAAVQRAEAIIASDRPLTKINDDPSWYLCKFCDHSSVCHDQQAPAINCRTCLHSTPVDNGKWQCERHNTELTTRQQKSGCDSHLYRRLLMNTELMLFARYEKPYVRLEDVCDELFNLCERKAKEAAAAQKLPVPVLRMTDSRKSPMMIKLSDLAEYLDSRHEEYTRTWEKVKNLY